MPSENVSVVYLRHLDDMSSVDIPQQKKSTTGGAGSAWSIKFHGQNDLGDGLQHNFIVETGLGNADADSTIDQILIGIVAGTKAVQTIILIFDGGSCGANQWVALAACS